MSKDVIRPLLKAVADLPNHYTGLVLGVINALRGPESEVVAERIKNALAPSAKVVDLRDRFTFTAPVNRTLTPKEALSATRRVVFLNEEVVATWPLSTGDSVTMLFYNFGRYIEGAKLDEELAKVGLELVVDPTGLAAINQACPKFADVHPNVTQWKNHAGKFYSAVFHRYSDERTVIVDCNDSMWWSGDWWYPVRSIAKV